MEKKNTDRNRSVFFFFLKFKMWKTQHYHMLLVDICRPWVQMEEGAICPMMEVASLGGVTRVENLENSARVERYCASQLWACATENCNT
jgi:hypothetical protein